MAAAIGIAKTATEIFLGVGEVSIDNLTFKLHYKWSVTLFIVCSVLVQTSQFFGDPVQCETAEDSVDDDVLNSFCWMYSSFDMPAGFTGPCTRKRYDSTYLYNTYYQWVSVFLATQAVIFYIPRCIWLMLEGGLMSYIVKGTTGRVVDDAEDKIGRMLKHFQEHVHNKFNRYAFGFFCCELLNPILSLFSVYLTHKFLRDQYLSYGLLVYRFYSVAPEERTLSNMVDPMCEVFPKMAACHYHRYGMGGREDDRHAICILGLNMINDKVFVLLWVWHVFLVLVGSIRILTRSSQLLSAKIRYFLMRLKMQRYFKNNAHVKHIQHYVRHCSIGDWFVLYQMSKNLNKRFFAEFFTLLALTVNPDPSIEPEEPEIYLTEADIERHKNGSLSSRKGSLSSSGSISEDEESGRRGNPLMKCEGEIDTSLEGGGPGGGLSGKQRMLIKQGKGAMAAKHKAMMATTAVRRLRRR